MKDVNFAVVAGDAIIGDVNCTHLAFGRPDVDFQLWVADGNTPYPCKYVVTDTSAPSLISTVTVLGSWTFDPDMDTSVFHFVPPAEARPASFLPHSSSSENQHVRENIMMKIIKPTISAIQPGGEVDLISHYVHGKPVTV